MDVIIRVAYRHPPRPTRIITFGDTGAVQEFASDLAPLAVAEHPIPTGDPRRAMPHIAAFALGPAILGQTRGHRGRLQRPDQRPRLQIPLPRARRLGLPSGVPSVP